MMEFVNLLMLFGINGTLLMILADQKKIADSLADSLKKIADEP